MSTFGFSMKSKVKFIGADLELVSLLVLYSDSDTLVIDRELELYNTHKLPFNEYHVKTVSLLGHISDTTIKVNKARQIIDFGRLFKKLNELNELSILVHEIQIGDSILIMKREFGCFGPVHQTLKLMFLQDSVSCEIITNHKCLSVPSKLIDRTIIEELITKSIAELSGAGGTDEEDSSSFDYFFLYRNMYYVKRGLNSQTEFFSEFMRSIK